MRSIEWVSGTDFADFFDATGFTTTATIPLPNAGDAGSVVGLAFNRYEGRGGNDTITGNGNTEIAFDNATAGVTVTFSALNSGTSHGTANGDAANVATDTFTGVNRVRGSDFDDFIGPDAGANIFDGRGGNDTLQGGGGNDTLNGGSGFDRAVYSDATGLITVNLAAGTVSRNGVGNDTLQSIESVRGTNFDDIFVAGSFSGSSTNAGSNGSANNIEGFGGNDTITGNGNTRISYLSATSGVTVNFTVPGPAGTATGDGSVGTDRFPTGVISVRGSILPIRSPEVLRPSSSKAVVVTTRSTAAAGLIGWSTTTTLQHYSGITVDLAAGTLNSINLADTSIGADTLHSVKSVAGQILMTSSFFGDWFQRVEHQCRQRRYSQRIRRNGRQRHHHWQRQHADIIYQCDRCGDGRPRLWRCDGRRFGRN